MPNQPSDAKHHNYPIINSVLEPSGPKAPSDARPNGAFQSPLLLFNHLTPEL